MFSRSLGSYSCFPLPSWEGFEKLISAFGSLPEVEMQPLDLRKHCLSSQVLVLLVAEISRLFLSLLLL